MISESFIVTFMFLYTLNSIFVMNDSIYLYMSIEKQISCFSKSVQFKILMKLPKLVSFFLILIVVGGITIVHPKTWHELIDIRQRSSKPMLN
jgi:hypothetical protein